MLVRFAGLYEFQAVATGGWAVYLNDPLAEHGSRHLGTWDTLAGAHAAVKAPPFDDDCEDIADRSFEAVEHLYK